jgi:prepilin-type N-terminal cleavage/methylation domain-containing protein
MRSPRHAFTLIELMIVVAVIGILAAIAVPKFAEAIVRSKEATVSSNLGTLRSSLSIYYANTEGIVPADLDSICPEYIKAIPIVTIPAVSKEGTPGHIQMGSVAIGPDTGISEPTASDIWYLVNQGSLQGKIVVNCSHNTSKGIPWSSY